MDKQEARSLLTEQLATYRARSYADLVAMIGQDDCVEIPSPSGQRYQVEYGAFWDNKPGGNVSVECSRHPVDRRWDVPRSVLPAHRQFYQGA